VSAGKQQARKLEFTCHDVTMYGPVEGLQAIDLDLLHVSALAYADDALCGTSAGHVQSALPTPR
jgi:hypothetical protein